MRDDDLPLQKQRRVRQLLKDGPTDLVHQARERLRDDWSNRRSEAHMQEQARSIRQAIASDLAEDLALYVKSEADDELMKDLEEQHVRTFVQAAELGWDDA